MAAVGEISLQRNSFDELKTMFKSLFEVEYYSKRLELQKSVGLHIRLETAIRTDGIFEKVDLEEKILEDVSNSNGPLSTLVLGDSGTGKSWLALNLTKNLYNSTQPEFKNKIPVYIPLGRIEKMVSQQKAQASSSFRSDILFSYIMNHRNHFPFEDWKLQNLYLDLCDCQLIFILDGYDELKVKSNLWEENSWRTFKNVRTIVSCRSNALAGVDVSKIFGFSEEHQCIYVISQLEGIVVEKYISQVPLFLFSIEYDSMDNGPWKMTKSVTKDYPKWESAKEDSEYKHWFLDKLPELQGLAQNVFILTIICQLLPKLVEAERTASNNEQVTDEFMRNLQEICRIEVLLYDRFTETWFNYQVERMEPTGHARCLYENRGTLHHYMGGYAQNLAMRCAQRNRGMLSNGEISEDETLFWNLWTPWSPNSEKFQRNESVEKQLFPQDENDTNEDRLRNLKFLRDSCLLRYESCAKVFEFLHLSLFEYFLSREVFEKYRGALNYYSNWNRSREGVYFLINQNNINGAEFSGVLSMLVGRAEKDGNFQTTLLETIKRSATLPGIEQMASNAFTILNLSGYSFSGKNNEGDNFQNIQVPGANLRNSICGNSDFSGANFENAKLNQGWFQGCTFKGANFSNCSFGQISPISLGTNKFSVHDILCYTIDGFEHVVICCQEQSATAGYLKLYVKNFKLNAKFEFVECKSMFAQEISKEVEYLFSLIELPSSVILFVFSSCVIEFLNEKIMLPDTWYEFSSSDSIVKSGKFRETEFKLLYHLKFFKEPDSAQKFLVFFPNKLPEFCDEEISKSYYDKNRQNGVPLLAVCWIKYISIQFGPFKFLVSTSSRRVDEIGSIVPLENIESVSVLHNWKPILCNDEGVPLEIFWQVDNSGDKVVQEAFLFHQISIHCRGTYFDDNVILSFPTTANIYFFDLKHNKVLTVLKNTIFTKRISNDNNTMQEKIAIASFMDQYREGTTKILKIPIKRSAACFVSKNFEFIALKHPLSTEVFRSENGTLSQNILKDFETPISIKNSKGSTYLVSFFKSSLHFEKLEPINSVAKIKARAKHPVGKYFSEDGSLGIVFPLSSRAAIFDVWKFHSEQDGHALEKIFDWSIQYTNSNELQLSSPRHGVLITPHNFVVVYFCLVDPPSPLGVPQLNAYDVKCRQIIDLKGIPADRIFPETEILMFQDLQKIAFRNDQEFACYSITEIECGLELVHDITFTFNFEYSEFAFDPNEKRSYIFYKGITDMDRIGVWNLENNEYVILQVRDQKVFLPDTTLCTVLLKNKIIQGYCKKDSFYIKGSNEYSRSHAESPVHVLSSSKLGWILAQFRTGDLVILDSRKLETLFFFCGFLPGYKFHITLKSPQEVRIALVQEYGGELVWLSINAVSLREFYEKEKLEEFKDWKVDKSELPSSSLSLREVDISCSRAMDKRLGSLFNFHGSLGSPSNRDSYKSFCNLFLPVTYYPHSILITSDNEQPTDLTKTWTVTVIARKSKFTPIWISKQRHAALIIEGILHGGHFVIRAELTRENKVVKLKCEPYRGKSRYEEIIKNYDGKQIRVNPTMGMKLLKNIWVDTYNPQWKYNLLFHNCNSWCKKKLEVLNIENAFKSKPYKLFADLPQDFELQEFFKFST